MFGCIKACKPESTWNTPGCRCSEHSLIVLAAISCIVIGALGYSNIYFAELGKYGGIAMMAGGSLLVVEPILSACGKGSEISILALAAIASIVVGALAYSNVGVLSGIGRPGAIAMMAGGSFLLVREMLWCKEKPLEQKKSGSDYYSLE